MWLCIQGPFCPACFQEFRAAAAEVLKGLPLGSAILNAKSVMNEAKVSLALAPAPPLLRVWLPPTVKEWDQVVC